MGFKRVEKMIKVTDDWCPNYPNNEIKLKLALVTYNGHFPYIVLCAWGMDDKGVEKFYDADTKEKKKNLLKAYNEMLKEFESIPDFVCYKWFLQHGFTPA
jgi:hypothetical protein